MGGSHAGRQEGYRPSDFKQGESSHMPRRRPGSCFHRQVSFGRLFFSSANIAPAYNMRIIRPQRG